MFNNFISYIVSFFGGVLLGILSILLVIFGFGLWINDARYNESKTKYIKPLLFLIGGILGFATEFFLLFKLGYLIFM